MKKNLIKELPPFRAPLLTAAEIEAYAGKLAGEHRLAGLAPINFLNRLQDNEKVLFEIRDQLSRNKSNRSVVTAGEWILDNFYIIEDQVQRAKKFLETGDHEKLPVIIHPVYGRIPRLYDIVIELIAHTNGQIEMGTLINYISSYQKVACLQANELRTVSTMLRHILIENLRRLASRIVKVGNENSEDQISIRNNITSLGIVAAADWQEVIETLNVVERILATEENGVYAKMDADTRDLYCRAIEQTARASKLTEPEIATFAIRLAKAHQQKNGGECRTSHVGYYLVEAGRVKLEQLAGVRLSPAERLRRFIRAYPLVAYMGVIAFITCALAAALLPLVIEQQLNVLAFAVVSIVVLLCASQLGVTITNRLVSFLLKPALLSRMDYSKGLPAHAQTLVVVPVIPGTAAEIKKIATDLEVRYLGNRDKHLHFGLLTDLPDADNESLPTDAALVKLLEESIDALNRKYAGTHGSFFLFHRTRKWNPAEECWMGYERKRGKLEALNALLHTGSTKDFSIVKGNTGILKNIRYVITLDADTQLPPETAHKLIGTISHPLNKAVYDDKKGRVIKGYGILQPEVMTDMQEMGRSRYVQMYGSNTGIDPYSRASSNIYQDLFGEGSFVGKGIYDVRVFYKAMYERFPENTILSHDLLEGCYTRSGLASDIKLYEKSPVTYYSDVKRRHRWIRGDWQVARWVLPLVPGKNGSLQRNPLSALSRWKLFDNLRRSLVPVACMLLLVAGWTILNNPAFWTLFVLAILMTDCLVSVVEILAKNASVLLSVSSWWKGIQTSLSGTLLQHLYAVISLPHEAFSNADAIVRTNWRMFIVRKRLLQWNNFASTAQDQPRSLWHNFRFMWIAPVTGIGLFIYLALVYPQQQLLSYIMLSLWIASPAVSWWLSRPMTHAVVPLQAEQQVFLRRVARKTWSFFETFVNKHENWLPPDNYQEHPVQRVAHYTSPTNIGLTFLANLSAWDFGYITMGEFVERTGNTMDATAKLERYKGHFYNWYDTSSLKPVHPRYVSTVDSGNLAGHLLTLRQGLLAMPQQKILGPQLFTGLIDTLLLIEEKMPSPAVKQCKTELENAALSNIRSHLQKLIPLSLEIVAAARNEKDSTVIGWANAFERQCRSVQQELTMLAPWIMLPPPPTKWNLNLNEIPALCDVPQLEQQYLTLAENYRHNADEPELEWLRMFNAAVAAAAGNARSRIAVISSMADQCIDLSNMEYDFVYNRSVHLLSIGYNVEMERPDDSYYNLLASECRLGSFVAIASGAVPQEHWFALGRQVVDAEGVVTLLSWNGTMFEYLMPLLVMPDYKNTLLHETCKAIVKRQMNYAKKHNIPWGISECCYNALDANYNYQYRACGLPGVSLKRGHKKAELVVAPYASVMALMVSPQDACENLLRLKGEGAEGEFGFFEAVDYNANPLPARPEGAVVRSFMVHHQAMSFLSIAYLLLNKPMQERFEREAQFQATLLLLQEKLVKETALCLPDAALSDQLPSGTDEPLKEKVHIIPTPHTPVPEVKLLSNGRYHTMISNAGGGYSFWKGMAITRWLDDGTCDNKGTFCYIRDLKNDEHWSVTHQPVKKPAKRYEARFSTGTAGFYRLDNDIETQTSVVVPAEQDMEVRRIVIRNCSAEQKLLEITTCTEVMLMPPAAEAFHPSFGNLFIQTEIANDQQGIVCMRRPRAATDSTPWMFQQLSVQGSLQGEVSYETDRMKFIGRGRTLADPAALNEQLHLSNTAGAPLDPVLAIRCRIALPANATAVVDIISGVSESRQGCTSLMHRCMESGFRNSIVEKAGSYSSSILKQIRADVIAEALFNRLAGRIIYPHAAWRANAEVRGKGKLDQSYLWKFTISGDLPIVLLRIQNPAQLQLVQQLIQAHSYWRLHGLETDLIMWNDDHGSYPQFLQSHIVELITAITGTNIIGKHGGIFLLTPDQVTENDAVLLQSAATIFLSDENGDLQEQLAYRDNMLSQAIIQPATRHASPYKPVVLPEPRLLFFNGCGGFTTDGKEYLIKTTPQQNTPLPWVNVLANPNFGTVITETGQSHTWAGNSQNFRLTPWSNDAICGNTGEAYYLRDEVTGHYWSPSPGPARAGSTYLTRHGFGYTVFECGEAGIHSEMWMYADIKASIKIIVLKTRNRSREVRKLTATGYVEWVLGHVRSRSALHTKLQIDHATGALMASNLYNPHFANRLCFFTVNDAERRITTDRTGFIGRNSTLCKPEAMSHSFPSNGVHTTTEPCGAMQVAFELMPEQEHEVIFMLGAATDVREAREMIQKFSSSAYAAHSLEKVRGYWKHVLGAIQVKTPDTSLNLLTNGWLLYQTIVSRLWAKCGFYQSIGAYGFRDQLQDVMAVCHAEPQLARKHILLCASRQFREGDVMHWWQAPDGHGVRTRCSDDLLWLPFVACRYVNLTGDASILDEEVPFLEAGFLAPGESSMFGHFPQSPETGSLYEHCVRAIRCATAFGVHGLPLMGCGDVNDSMDAVGKNGKGESVWLAFFLYNTLTQFARLSQSYGDAAFTAHCKTVAHQLQVNLAKHAWDGEWYLRAYFDNGVPLGTSVSRECRIDSISQSWAVLSGAGHPVHCHKALESAYQQLVCSNRGVVKLLYPSFDTSDNHPGYIQGYVPGIRENGGQCTQAAVWMIMAFAAMGDGKRAWELFRMIDPIHHGHTPENIKVYKVEPYVMAADVYAHPQHNGRGGWTWFTGAAGWMYQLVIESLLGLKREGDLLRFSPCVPAEWNSFSIDLRYKNTSYRILINVDPTQSAETYVTLDGVIQPDKACRLSDDEGKHWIKVYHSTGKLSGKQWFANALSASTEPVLIQEMPI